MDKRRGGLVTVVLALAGGMFAVLQAVVVPALPDISRGLHASPSDGTWILTINLLATAVLTPVLGRMGDIYGKDRMLRIVLALLASGTLICALAPSLSVMLIGRVAQGAGGAVFPLAFGVLRDELDHDRVAGAIGLVSSLLGIGAGLGLAIAGPISGALGWRWLFWLPLAVLVPVGVATFRGVPRSPVSTPAPVDLRAAALMITGLTCLLVAISEASAWGLSSPRMLGLLGIGVVLVVAWVRHELVSRHPLVDMRLMAQRGVWTTNLAAFLLGVGMYASIALVPALVELPRSSGVGFGASVTVAGLFMLPTAAPQLLVGSLAGRITSRIGSRPQVVTGIALMLIGYLALTVAHRHPWQIVTATAALGLGLGFALGAMANLIVGTVGPSQTGVATAMNTVMRTLGGAFGAALTAACLAAGGPLDGRFKLAFGLCAAALALGLLAAIAIPARPRSSPQLAQSSDPSYPRRPRHASPQQWPVPGEGLSIDRRPTAVAVMPREVPAVKAVRVHSYQKPATLDEVDDPKLRGPLDVILEVGGAGLCRTDLHIIEGQWAEKSGVELPYIIGHENAGWVREIGSAVTSVAVGDAVICHPLATCGLCPACRAGDDVHCEHSEFPGISTDGGMAEYLRTNARSVVKLEAGLEPADVAALADAGLTAYHAVRKAVPLLRPGTHVVNLGAGGLGHIGVQCLVAMTAAEITVVDRNEAALELAKELGAHHAVLADGQHVEAVRELTKGGAQVVIDYVGENGTEAEGVAMLRRAGSYFVVGYGGHVDIPTIDIISTEINIIGNLVGSYTDLAELMSLAAGGLVKLHTRRYGLDDYAQAIDDLDHGRVRGRAILVPG